MSRKSSKIPCKFPASREFEVGDRSDQDCVVSQNISLRNVSFLSSCSAPASSGRRRRGLRLEKVRQTLVPVDSGHDCSPPCSSHTTVVVLEPAGKGEDASAGGEDADECEPRTIRVRGWLVACQAASRGACRSPGRPERQAVPERSSVARQASLVRLCPFPDCVWHWCSCHLGVAVPRRPGQTDDRELVPAAWLVVGGAGRASYAEHLRHDRAGRARRPASQRNVARFRRGAAKRRSY